MSGGRLRVVLFLAEGATEEAFYRKLLEKHYNATPTSIDALPTPVRELLAPLQARRPTPLQAGETTVVLVGCGGFEGVKLCLRRLLARPELGEAVHSGLEAVIVAVDLDKNPGESLRGLLASQAPSIRGEDGALKVAVDGAELAVHIVAQGATPSEKQGATMQLEDHLEEIASRRYKHIAGAISRLEEALGGKLNAKQRLTITWALLEPRPHASPAMAARLAEEATREELEEAMPEPLALLDRYTASGRA